jgi:glycosyltransferase involved in cell wall biosynthesis
LVLSARPNAKLDIAGTVSRAFSGDWPPGVRFLGLVPDLDPLYEAAGVVISPLTFGSGLKIKLIEALAKGKAIVATSVTLHGVENECRDGVCVADDPASFANSIVRLLGNDEARHDLASRALETARQHFSAAQCYAGFTEWLRSRTNRTS